MKKQTESPKPLTSAQVKRLKSLPPEGEPPRLVALNLDTFQLPEGVKAQIVQVEGRSGVFQVRAELPGYKLGQRIPYARIPTLKLDRKELKARPLAEVNPQGLR